jgi:histidinol-phosphate/aromatic aminotransferase/cobyric acid decarboxylase-like protein
MMVPAPGPHGGDAREVARILGIDPSQMLDLSASLNPFAADPATVIGRHLASLGDYPNPMPSTELFADAVGVPSDRLVLTNGGSEAIKLVADHLGRGHIVEPEFSLYRRHLAALDESAGRWRSNPSNPLGTLADPHDQAAVWDEAFYPLATGAWSRGDDRAWRLGSLTKLWACPGLRLGYVIAPSAREADRIREQQPRWSVNGLALAALPDFLASTDLAGWASCIGTLRASFAAELTGMGLVVTPSAANWVLVHQVPDLRSALALQGIAVRDCASFAMPGTVRIALPHPCDVDRVLVSISAALAKT